MNHGIGMWAAFRTPGSAGVADAAISSPERRMTTRDRAAAFGWALAFLAAPAPTRPAQTAKVRNEKSDRALASIEPRLKAVYERTSLPYAPSRRPGFRMARVT